MQIGGLGSSHDTSDHHVTNCIHDHHEVQKKTGGAAMQASAAMEASAAKSELQQEGLFSLSAWLKSMLGNRKGFLLSFWEGGQAPTGEIEGNKAAVNGTEGSRTAAPQSVAYAGDLNMAAAAAAVVQPTIQSHQSLWQKMRVRFHNVSGRLSRRRPQKFFGFQTKNSFRARQEMPEENLRKYSRYRKDTVEINCARTEESYLMDSYDRKGEYSRLTTKK